MPVRADGDNWVRNFRSHTERADIFMQVIGDSLGDEMLLEDGSKKPALVGEYEIYKTIYDASGTGRPAFVGFNLTYKTNTSQVKDFLTNDVGATGGTFLQCPTQEHFLNEAIDFCKSQIVPNDSILMFGSLTKSSECSGIYESLIKHILSTDTFPQKYLYATLRGAALWKWLSSSRSGSTIAQVYDQSPFRNSQHAVTRELLDVVKTTVHKPANPDRRLGVIVLGCGDGRREAEICERILADGIANSVKVILTDVSSELIESAWHAFERLGSSCEVTFSVLDFQSFSALYGLRQDQCFGMPALTLLLGNTLGNLDELAVLREIKAAMATDDVVAAEMLLVDPRHVASSSRTESAAGNDVRFEFITTPLRLLGIEPKQSSFFRIVEIESGIGMTHRFRYKFKELTTRFTIKDQCSGVSTSLDKNSWIDLLQIRSLVRDELFKTVNDAGLINVAVKTQNYKLKTGPDVVMGYVIAKVT